jgi:hypothetical protein
MRRIIVVGILGLLFGVLPALAAPYDHDNVVPAELAYQAQVKACQGMMISGTLYDALYDCYIAADRAFAVAIKLERKDLTDAYIAKVRELAKAIKDDPSLRPQAQQAGARLRASYLWSIAALDGGTLPRP